jgi:hypothetical protein
VVTKGKHKKSGVLRAIKSIKKSMLTPAEQQKLMNEVEILRNLVILVEYRP